MKKKYLINLLFSFFVVSFCFCGIYFFNNTSNNNIFGEEEIPSYFTVTQYQNDNTAIATIPNGGVAYVATTHTVKAEFKSDTVQIKHISPYFTLNGQSYDNDILHTEYGIQISYSTISFTLTSSFVGNQYPCGKYSLTINYIMNENGVDQNKSFTFTYYVLMENDYYNGQVANVKMDNAFNVNSSLYDNAYQYQYQYNNDDNNTNQIPKLTFDKTKINISINKTFQSTSTTQNITYNGTSIVTDNNLVVIVENNNNYVDVYFNDLGFYTISYNFIYSYDNKVDYIQPKDYSNSQAKLTDCIDIFGYQAYYSDVNSGTSKEFKIFENGQIGSQYADITYISENQYNNSLDNSENSALTAILAAINAKTISIPTTNQAPVQFKYNVEIFNNENSEVLDTQSGYYILTKDQNGLYEHGDKQNYDNSPFSQSGIYLVKLVYKNNSKILGFEDNICSPSYISETETEFLRCQWFLFEITKDTDSMSINAVDNNSSTNLLDGAYTNKNVEISKNGLSASVFNAKTKIVLYKQSNYTGNYVEASTILNDETYTATENGNYIATLFFGKNYTRSYSTTFTIDKNEIDNIQIFAVEQQSNSSYYTRGNQIEFLTNQPVIVSWNEKQSNSQTVAEYKYIPLVSNFSNNFSSSILKEYYSYNCVPVDYYFDFTNTELLKINYQNAINYTYIPSSSVLSQPGMYIFRVGDSAGNEKYFSFIIDTTNTNVLQLVNNEFVEPSDLNIISQDAKIVWGEYKVIKFNNLVYDNSSASFNSNDEWLNKILNNTNIYDEYFTNMSINTQNTYFTKIAVNQKVLKISNGTEQIITANEDTVQFLSDFNGQMLAEEKDYTYYIIDASNTKINKNNISNQDYKNNYSGIFQVRISSDASMTLFTYETTKMLELDSYSPAPHDNTKEQYFIPTTAKTLSNSNEILTMQFNPTPDEGVVEVETITYTFSPFIPKSKVNPSTGMVSAYSYVFGEQTSPITIYSKNNPNENKNLTLNANGSYSWEINKEYIYNGSSYIEQTQAGRYTVTRTYSNFSGTQSALDKTYDYLTRTFTFIIDRNSIITSPTNTDNGLTYSYVGESIKIQVLEEENDKMFFKDIYLANNSQAQNTPILTTNKLPVFVYIPVVKYGYSYTDGGTFNKENTINYYNFNPSNVQQTNASEIKTFALTAQIKFSTELSTLDTTNIIYNSLDPSVTNNRGYLKFSNDPNSSGLSFTQIGYYKVTITQGYEKYGANTLSFIFQITEQEPSFTVVDAVNNEELPKETTTGNYYTNKETVRITWTDSANEFMAKINKEEITYTINNSTPQKIDSSLIQTNNLTNYIDINLNELKAYNDQTKITFTMQYEGKESDYNTGKFKTSRTVIIDTTAPQKNINNLVSLSEINYDYVRDVQLKYNTSVATGLYKYFAFAVDVNNFANIFDLNSYENGETYLMLYRPFRTTTNENKVISTKYNEIYAQETPVAIIENSTSSFEVLNEATINNLLSQENYNSYIEIVEIDLAGNITIYTIYLTNINYLEQTSATPITYLSNGISKSLAYSQIQKTTNLNAKGNLSLTQVNMMNYDWNLIEINNISYLKTPYSNDKYYNLSTYDESNPSQSEIDLTNFAYLQSSSKKQNIYISLVPYYNNITLSCSVLNTSLNVIHTTETSLYNTQEGILIQIPSYSSEQDASIYATSVIISEFIETNGSYTENIIFNITDDNYFKTSDQDLINNTMFSSSYINYMGNTYMKISLKSPVKDRFYSYTVKDNFEDIYAKTNIYGAETVENELTSEVKLVEQYENGQLIYYSTKEIRFKYNSKKDKLVLNVTTSYTSYKYDLSLQQDRERLQQDNIGIILEPASSSSIYTLVLYAPKQDMANGLIGGEIRFSIELYEAIVETFDSPYKTINLVIYNIIPNFTLLGINNESQNDLFNKGTMYGNQIKITYNQSTARIPCLVYLEYKDGTIEEITSGKIVSTPATYSLIVKYSKIFTDKQYDVYLDFRIVDNDEEFYQVVYKNGNEYVYATPTNNPFSYTEGNRTQTISRHYILNTSEFELIYNTEQGIQESEPTIVLVSGYVTYIYEISNLKSENINKYYKTIAISVIPKSTSILTNYSHYTNMGLVNLTGTLTTFAVSNKESSNTTKTIAWKSYYGIKENIVSVHIKYNDNATTYVPKTTTKDGMTYLTLTTSGTYYLTFSDCAGNVHMFNSTISTYTIRYLKSVIYNVNDQAPINNAIYNDDVKVNIPTSTKKYYDNNAQPQIHVLKNGEEYTPITDKDNNTYTFNETGLYKIWFTAAVTISGEVTQINEEPLYFLILRPRESRYAFEFSEYANYYIKQIIKNNEDVTSTLTNENMGKLTYKTIKLQDDTEQTIAYLKNILISTNDAITGNGQYTITICTDNEFNQEFTFSFWINNKQPSIIISQEENSTTTKPINVSFNTANLIEDVGDCVLKITGRPDITLTEELLQDGKLQSSYNISLTEANTYFVQLYSESGKLLYSYRIIKTDPLNTVSIILIVVSCVVVIGLTITFILLRKRMKIR